MDDNKKQILTRYAERVGYNESDLRHLTEDDPRARHIQRLSQAAAKYSIVAEVVESRHCSSGYKQGDKFILDVDGNFISKLCPKKMCVYLTSQLVVPVALINERLSEGLDPNQFHFMHQVRCPDSGVDCSGYGQVTLKVSVVPRS
jgi:uncharacterized repeat protein (TIGR04076 family)